MKISDLDNSVMWEYTLKNISLAVLGEDKPLPSWSEVRRASEQLRHFAKQGVKVRLK